jgi:hypothetical protein
MKIFFKNTLLEDIRKAKPKSKVLQDDDYGYNGKDVESKFIDKDDFELIKKIASKPAHAALIENRRVVKKLVAIESLKQSGSKAVIPKRLEVMAEAVGEVVGKTKHKWVFLARNNFGVMLPYFVKDVEYHRPDEHRGSNSHANTTITLSAISRGETDTESIVYSRDDLGGTVEELLAKRDIFLETDQLVAEYEAELAKYEKFREQTGEQFLATGAGSAAGNSKWHRDRVQFEREGIPAKLVMDDGLDQGSDSGYVETKFWKAHHTEDEEEQSEVYKVPVHPIVRAFNLGTHDYVDAYITSLKPYEYDASAATKLVLPGDHVELIDAMTGNAIRKMEDIIRGKALGIIVMCSGEPGTGKTLTAEVYSEIAKRPLYMVQCSQLGTDEEKLEERLAEVLDRARRWRAILLIDEADVYIHERGDDIQQNAIVGVFLRLLEYFNGIMFLTTNRDTIIDDAILSRATAHVRYAVAEVVEERRRLWEVLAKQYGATDLSIKEMLLAFPKITGRSVRQLLKLARIMADHRGKPLDAALVKWAAKFHDFSEKEEAKF